MTIIVLPSIPQQVGFGVPQCQNEKGSKQLPVDESNLNAASVRSIANEIFNDPEFGDLIRDGIVSRTIPGQYDPDTQQATIRTQSSTCRLFWVGFTRMQLAQDLVRDAKLRYCRIGYLDLGFELRPEDQLQCDGATYDILQCSDFSAGTGAFWEVTVR